MDIKQFLSSLLSYELKYQESFEGNDQQVYCYGCYKLVSGPAYVYTNSSYDKDTFALHKTCAESPREIQHPLHPHPLKADWVTPPSFSVRNRGFLCQGCGHYCFGFGYWCDTCHFKVDLPCAFNLSIRKEEKIREIAEDFHDHKLQRFHHNTTNRQDFKDIFCSYCSNSFNGSGFACVMCDLFIHERCMHKLPRGKEIRSPFHLDHPLLLKLSAFGYGLCRACNGIFRPGAIVLSCHLCGINDGFHFSCGSVTTFGLRLKNYHEDHPLLYVYVHSARYPEMVYVPSTRRYIFKKGKCVVCNTKCQNCHVYTCLGCDVFVHLECIPLPRVVKHQSHAYDDHVLTLSDLTNRREFSSGTYHCIVCEKEGYLNRPFYHCEDCSDIAHIDCILDEEDPPSEIVEYLVPLEKCETNSDEEYLVPGYAATPEEESEEDCDEEQVDLEGCTVVEIDKRIAAIKKQIKKIALQIEVHRKARLEKLNKQPQLTGLFLN